MSNEIDNYKSNRFLGNVIKVTSDPNDQECVDRALGIAHIVGNVMETVTDNNTIP